MLPIDKTSRVVTRIKICCIRSIAEAQHAINAGANLLGLVSKMPSGPGVIDEHTIAQIADIIPPGVESVLLTSLQRSKDIVRQHQICLTTAIQLTDALEHRQLDKLKNALPGIRLIQVIHVNGEQSLTESESLQNRIDALLLDSGNPTAKIKTLGGTGRVHDWQISARIVKDSDLPVFLAGGLNSDNISDAINTVKPFGVDVCSGVRTDGRLDVDRLDAFCCNVKAYDQSLKQE